MIIPIPYWQNQKIQIRALVQAFDGNIFPGTKATWIITFAEPAYEAAFREAYEKIVEDWKKTDPPPPKPKAKRKAAG